MLRNPPKTLGLDEAIAQIAGSETGQIDDVLGATEGRCVGQLEMTQIIDGRPCADARGEYVETLVHALGAGHLRAEHTA